MPKHKNMRQSLFIALSVIKKSAIGWVLMFTSCTGLFMDEQKTSTAISNFDLLWKIMDERYCYFEEKEVDWDAMYQIYSDEVLRYSCGYNPLSDCVFNTMTRMLLELRDGHVSLSDGYMTRTYEGWFNVYENNYDITRMNIYRNSDKHTVNLTISTSISVLPEGVGYLRCQSFSDKFNRYELDDALKRFEGLKGVIIDVRNNGGGLVSEAYLLASKFSREKTHVGYVRYKTGKGHNDFSDFYARYVEPDGKFPFHGKIAILTNRRVYSAANLFVSIMTCLPDVRVMGDNTGGGGGLPISAELYNGWTVQLSTNPVFDIEKQSIEKGIEPHVLVAIGKNSQRDDIIEEAKKWILAN